METLSEQRNLLSSLLIRLYHLVPHSMLSKMMTGFVINFLLIVNCISNLAQEQQDDGLTDTVPVLNETISHNGEGNSTIECVPRNLSESEVSSFKYPLPEAIKPRL